MEKERTATGWYRFGHACVSLVTWSLYVFASWWLIDHGDTFNYVAVPVLFTIGMIVTCGFWFSFESWAESRLEEDKKDRVITWVYPYTYVLAFVFSVIVWIVLWVHEDVYGEAFVRPAWIYFVVNAGVFFWILTLCTFYVHEAY